MCQDRYDQCYLEETAQRLADVSDALDRQPTRSARVTQIASMEVELLGHLTSEDGCTAHKARALELLQLQVQLLQLLLALVRRLRIRGH